MTGNGDEDENDSARGEVLGNTDRRRTGMILYSRNDNRDVGISAIKGRNSLPSPQWFFGRQVNLLDYPQLPLLNWIKCKVVLCAVSWEGTLQFGCPGLNNTNIWPPVQNDKPSPRINICCPGGWPEWCVRGRSEWHCHSILECGGVDGLEFRCAIVQFV